MDTPSAAVLTPHSQALRASPLWVVLLFAFTNSIGSAVLSAGIFFLAENRFDFSRTELYGLGLVYGLTYIPGALLIGPLLRRLPADRAWGNPRAAIGAIMLLMAGMSILPVVFQQSWTLWAMMAVYSPISGMLWPMVESYVSGGRTGKSLRSAIGRFNVVWSSSLVFSMLVMSPFAKAQPLAVLTALACVHVVSAVMLPWFAPFPARHEHGTHVSHPPVYAKLLTFVQMLLPIAFMFVSALAPFLPSATRFLGLKPEHGPLLAAAWMAARVVTFFTLERWDGWHGRWWTPMLGVAALLGGFAITVMTPRLLSGQFMALPLVIFGLTVFGLGVGIIYCAALYYVMEIGSAGVDAGGKHEMLIGLGYTAGPACGLLGTSVSTSGEGITVIAVSAVALVTTAWALQAARSARASLQGQPAI